MMYKIIAQWENRETEVVDEAKDKAEAASLVGEYIMAYGSAATRVWYEKINEDSRMN